MNPRYTAITAMALVLAMTACSTGTDTPVAELDQAQVEEADTTVDQPQEEEQGGSAELESTHTFDDGLTVTLDQVERLERSELSDPPGEPFVRFVLTWDNQTDTQLDMTLLSTNCTVGEPGRTVDTVYDEGHDVDPWISSTLLPGNQVVATWGCEMEPDDTRLQVQLTLWEDQTNYDVIFTGDVA